MKKLLLMSLLLASGCKYVPATTKVVTTTTVVTPGFSSTLSIEQWCAIAAVLVAAVGLFFAWRQLRFTTRQIEFTAQQIEKNTKATNAQTLGGLHDSLIYINHTLIEHPAIAEQLRKPFVPSAESHSPTSLYIDTARNFFHEMLTYHKEIDR